MTCRCFRVLLTAFAMLLATSGCASLESTRRDLMSNDYVDGTDQFNDDSQAAKEGRGHMARESSIDPLWRMISSPKALDIEKNMGYDYP